MPGKVYFITGANRGIGLEYVKILAADPANTVIASARDVSKATELNGIAGKAGNIHVITLDVASESSIDELDSQLAKYAPEGIDYFVSNAGIAKKTSFGSALAMKKEVWVDHFTTNTIGPVLITQVVKPYLSKKDTKVIFLVTSIAGSIGGFLDTSAAAYGASKAALNFFARSLASELAAEGFVIAVVHPGFVASDMGNEALSWADDPVLIESFKSLVITPAQSAQKQIDILQNLTKEDNSKFFSYTGDEIPW